MVRRKIREAWLAPRVSGPPARVWRDWPLAGIVVISAVVEVLVRTDLVWPLPSLAMLVPVVVALLVRRRHPFLALAIVFVPIFVIDVYAYAARGVTWEGLYSNVVVLILMYALARWGAGREIILGAGLVLAVASLTIFTSDPVLIGDVLGGYLIVLATFEIGMIVRSQVKAREQAVTQTRLEEREQLARELHDTVAHHVSAIAIQAQAGRTLAATKPEAAVDALQVIEEEASRTLTEMRSIVAALRNADHAAHADHADHADGAARAESADYAPQPGVADIEQLADGNGGGVRVDVELTGQLGDLRPAVDTALFRLAQESITNAVRHARNVTRVAVKVSGTDATVRLTVTDDGDGATPGRDGYDSGTGFGLVGMRERTDLLGGTLEAGPRPGRGWAVDAVLPKGGGAR